VTAAFSQATTFMSRRPWLIAALVAVAYGVRLNDAREFAEAAGDPFRMVLPPERQFLYGSPLPLFIGTYYVHNAVPAAAAYAFIQVIGAALFLAGLLRAIGRDLDRETRTLALTVLLASPLLVTLLFWIGKCDLYLLGFFLLLISSEAPASRVALAILMLASHRELATALLVVQLVMTRTRWRSTATGLIAGHVLLAAYAGMLSPEPASRVDYALANGARLISLVLATPLLHLFTPALLACLYAVMRTLRQRHLAVIGVAFALAMVTQDFTRVFTIVSTPLLIEMARVIAATRPHAAVWVWPLALVQLHLAGSNLLWVHGVDIRVGQ
jgi:hypothetical protein